MLYLQRVLGWSALQTALGFLPAALIVAFGSPRVEPLIERVGTPRTIFAGVVAHVLGYALFRGWTSTPATRASSCRA